jgi:C1A family cysteine protease
VANGPCFGALPVYGDHCDFWNKKPGTTLHGYHAISIVGYDKEGFIIRNSWGKQFCEDGYTKIPYSDFKKLLEIWTVID